VGEKETRAQIKLAGRAYLSVLEIGTAPNGYPFAYLL